MKHTVGVTLTRGDVDFLIEVIEFLRDILDDATDAFEVQDRLDGVSPGRPE